MHERPPAETLTLPWAKVHKRVVELAEAGRFAHVFRQEPVEEQTAAAHDVTESFHKLPVIKECQRLKRENPGYVVMYQVRDFFEMYHNDAALSEQILGVAVFNQHEGLPEPVKMSGVPLHTLDENVKKFNEAGHGVLLSLALENGERRIHHKLPVESRPVGTTVLMPTVFDERGNFNRENKRRKVNVAEPIGPYQIYTREANYGKTDAYVMTDSGRLIYWSDTDSYRFKEEELDKIFKAAPEFVENILREPDKWIDYNYAAIADRLEEVETHNNPIRDARSAKYEAEREARLAASAAEAKAQEESFANAVNDIAKTLVAGERADVPKNFDKNPLLALFALYEINVPLATKGWINRHVKAVQIKDSRLTVWGSAKEITETFSRVIRELRDFAALIPPERRREIANTNFDDLLTDIGNSDMERGDADIDDEPSEQGDGEITLEQPESEAAEPADGQMEQSEEPYVFGDESPEKSTAPPKEWLEYVLIDGVLAGTHKDRIFRYFTNQNPSIPEAAAFLQEVYGIMSTSGGELTKLGIRSWESKADGIYASVNNSDEHADWHEAALFVRVMIIAKVYQLSLPEYLAWKEESSEKTAEESVLSPEPETVPEAVDVQPAAVPELDFDTVAQTVLSRVMEDREYLDHLWNADSRSILRTPCDQAINRVIMGHMGDEPYVYNRFYSDDDFSDALFTFILRESYAAKTTDLAQENQAEEVFGEVTAITDPAERAEIEAIFTGDNQQTFTDEQEYIPEIEESPPETDTTTQYTPETLQFSPPPVFFVDWDKAQHDFDLNLYKDRDIIGYDVKGVERALGRSGSLTYVTSTGAFWGSNTVPGNIYEQIQAYERGEVTDEQVRENYLKVLEAFKAYRAADISSINDDILTILTDGPFVKDDKDAILYMLEHKATNDELAAFLAATCEISGSLRLTNGDTATYVADKNGLTAEVIGRKTFSYTWEQITPILRALEPHWRAGRDAERAAAEPKPERYEVTQTSDAFPDPDDAYVRY